MDLDGAVGGHAISEEVAPVPHLLHGLVVLPEAMGMLEKGLVGRRGVETESLGQKKTGRFGQIP